MFSLDFWLCFLSLLVKCYTYSLNGSSIYGKKFFVLKTFIFFNDFLDVLCQLSKLSSDLVRILSYNLGLCVENLIRLVCSYLFTLKFFLLISEVLHTLVYFTGLNT